VGFGSSDTRHVTVWFSFGLSLGGGEGGGVGTVLERLPSWPACTAGQHAQLFVTEKGFLADCASVNSLAMLLDHLEC
jgi:hypothetical protein